MIAGSRFFAAERTESIPPSTPICGDEHANRDAAAASTASGDAATSPPTGFIAHHAAPASVRALPVAGGDLTAAKSRRRRDGLPRGVLKRPSEFYVDGEDEFGAAKKAFRYDQPVFYTRLLGGEFLASDTPAQAVEKYRVHGPEKYFSAGAPLECVDEVTAEADEPEPEARRVVRRRHRNRSTTLSS